jgi:hypothetical protein
LCPDETVPQDAVGIDGYKGAGMDEGKGMRISPEGEPVTVPANTNCTVAMVPAHDSS